MSDRLAALTSDVVDVTRGCQNDVTLAMSVAGGSIPVLLVAASGVQQLGADGEVAPCVRRMALSVGSSTMTSSSNTQFAVFT